MVAMDGCLEDTQNNDRDKEYFNFTLSPPVDALWANVNRG